MSLSLSKKAQKVKPSSTIIITTKAKEMKAKGISVVNFGVGEADFDTPENICNAAITAIHKGFTKYTPASGTKELKEEICKKFKTRNGILYEPEQIVVSNGGKHSIYNAFQAILNPGDEVIIPTPYWLSYPEMVRLADGIPVYAETTKEQGYKICAEQIKQQCTERTKALVLNTPNNPSGAIYTREELQEIADLAIERDFYIIADEMYEYFIYDNPHISIASLSPEIYRRTITCSGVSKSYAMTGWRIGYTGSSKEIAKLMSALQSHMTSNPNSIAQKAALEALRGSQDQVAVMKQEFDKRRKYMYNRMSHMPNINCLEPKGAFYVFVDVSQVCQYTYQGDKINSAEKLAKILLNDYHVAVIPCSDFGFSDHIRISYAVSMEEIEIGLNSIEKMLQ